MNKEDLRKWKGGPGGSLSTTYDLYPPGTTEIVTYFTHPKMIIGVHIRTGTKWTFWNNTKEVLLDAVHNGYHYTLGLDKYKSERSLHLRINNFVKYILNDN